MVKSSFFSLVLAPLFGTFQKIFLLGFQTGQR